MKWPSGVARVLGLGLQAAALASFLAPLLTRLVIGLAFYQTGRGKLENLENTAAFFAELGIPLPELNAAFVSRLECYGGLLLIAGLATRLTAALLGSTMIVALMTADKANFLKALASGSEIGLTDVTPVMYGLFLLWLLLQGPGVVSLDALVARWLGIKTPEPAPPPQQQP
ncbi:MAG: DoxX family protein [Vicinamibacteria bacterium]